MKQSLPDFLYLLSTPSTLIRDSTHGTGLIVRMPSPTSGRDRTTVKSTMHMDTGGIAVSGANGIQVKGVPDALLMTN